MRIPSLPALLALLFGQILLFLFVPVLMVAKPMKAGFIDNADIFVYGIVACAYLSRALKSKTTIFRFNWTPLSLAAYLGCVLYFALYLMSALLAKRMGLALLSGALWSYLGVSLALLGGWLIVTGRFGPAVKLVSYPVYSGVLVLLAGLSLVHGTWFSLLALPGLLTVIAWRISHCERAALEKLYQVDGEVELLSSDGSEGAKVLEAPYKVLPFIY